MATIEACIPATTSFERYYKIVVDVDENGSRIIDSRCTCPVGYKCKHIHKVLCRITLSGDAPILPPSKQVQRDEHRARQLARGCCVYLAICCRSEINMRDYLGSPKDFDQKILGAFFSMKQANECARAYVMEELDQASKEEKEEEVVVAEEKEDRDGSQGRMEDGGDWEGYEEEFAWDGSDDGDYEGINFLRVWVERRAIEDASTDFHK